MTYLTLFFSALVAATILPAQSEAVLVWHISQQPAQAAVFVLVATVGNLLGAVINWGIGRGIGGMIGRGICRGIGRGIAHKHPPKSHPPKIKHDAEGGGNLAALRTGQPFRQLGAVYR